MGKFNCRIYRKDATEDHAHKIPNGKVTGGMLMRPNGYHTHLYECDGGLIKETSLNQTGSDHTHETDYGPTGGMTAVPKNEGEPPKEPAFDENGKQADEVMPQKVLGLQQYASNSELGGKKTITV